MMSVMLEIQSCGDDATILRVVGDCDYGSRETLRHALAAVGASGVARVVVSLEACEYIDSSIVGTLLEYRRTLGDRFVLIVPEDRVAIHRILEILGLHATLGVRPSL